MRAKNLTFWITLGFAVVGYLVAVALYFAPARWHFSPTELAAIYPSSILAIMSMTDPSFGAIAFLLAPMNAVWYGIIGLIIGSAVKEILSRV